MSSRGGGASSVKMTGAFWRWADILLCGLGSGCGRTRKSVQRGEILDWFGVF